MNSESQEVTALCRHFRLGRAVRRNAKDNPYQFTLSPRRPGGEGRVRGADVLAPRPAHRTLPSLPDGPLPLPPEGRRGALVRGIPASNSANRRVGPEGVGLSTGWRFNSLLILALLVR